MDRRRFLAGGVIGLAAVTATWRSGAVAEMQASGSGRAGDKERSMMDDALAFASIGTLASKIREGAVGPVTLAEAVLARIEALDPRLHAFIGLTRRRALAEARAAQSALDGGHDLGPLHGVPYAVKDLYDVLGEATTGGTRWLAGNVARRDCAAVRRLSAAGMVLVGKTHTVQFAFGGVGINHDQGTPHNPWHRVPHAPGGSSSGSGVAVAAGLVPLALGTDTGGSVRIPAALCGTVGLKTTVGRISRAGVYPLSWTLDSVGPLTRSVEDAALVYHALHGADPDDDSTVGIASHDVLGDLRRGAKGLRVAFGETVFFDGVDKEVEAAIRGAGDVFRGLGAHVNSVAVPEVAAAMSEQKRVLMVAAEALAVNGRLLDEHADTLDPVVVTRMAAGRNLTASDYVTLMRRWAELRAQVVGTLADVDVLLVPTTMAAAGPIASIDATPESYADHNLKYLRNTSLGNVLNLCSVSLPCGFTREGLPIGLMIYAKPFAEAMALRAAWAFEQATEWHTRHPDLGWAR